MTKYLYHATFRPLLESIKKNGLGATSQTYWSESKPGVVYLAYDPDVAISFAETNKQVDEEWLDEIVLLKIPMDELDPDYLFEDENNLDKDTTLEYHKVIPHFEEVLDQWEKTI